MATITTYSTTATSPGELDGWCELHCHTPFSLRGAGSGIEALVARAAALGMPALAITDTMTLAGVVRFHTACRAAGIRPITGCELLITDDCPNSSSASRPPLPVALGKGAGGNRTTLLALARDRQGYANLCGLLTRANLAQPEPDAPTIPLSDLAAHRDGLVFLIGGCDGLVQRLLVAGEITAARAALARYAALLGVEALRMELRHELLPESGLLLARSAALAAEMGIVCVATNGTRHATPDDQPIYDLMTCVRLGLRVDEPHPERQRNAERHLKSAAALRPLFAAAPAAFASAAALAAACHVELLATRCVPPRVPLPEGATAATHLRALCRAALPARYPTPSARASAARQLDHELDVIRRLDLEEFFLVVHDIVRKGRELGIRCAGRGSAANSVVAYLLGITAVDPIAHRLLFERFLNPERQGMPDIDVDVQSKRRDELIRYVEATYTEAHAAMVANVVTYRLRLAVRDVAKTLGLPLPLVNRLTRCLPHFGRCSDIALYADDLARALASAEPGAGDARGWILPTLLALVPRLEGFPRHLSLHNGGILLTREPLTQTLPVRVSANGVRAVELDKDDVERLGFIKFDLLGLRTFDAIEACRDLITQTEGAPLDVDALPLDPPDPATMALVRAGQTLAVFQIESPGQWHLLARTQPETFDDLVIQTALFRPGPLQADMVHPYVARRQGRAPVQYAHPLLEPILRDTLGIVLFQEHVLEIAHHFAGLSYADADGFRRAMSHYRTSAEMEGMRAIFTSGAIAKGIAPQLANQVFDEISCFVGYGFCKSHAAAFARTIYQTAWLKAHYPAHYLAAFLSSQPAGFFPPSTVLEEAKQLGIPVLPVDIQASAAHFTVEPLMPALPALPAANCGMLARSSSSVPRKRETPASRHSTPTAASASHLPPAPPCSPPPRREGARERESHPFAIRIGLAQVKGVGADLALAIVRERANGPYRSLADFCARVGHIGRAAPLRREAVEALVAAGAFDPLGIPRRRLLWLLGEHWRDWQPARARPPRQATSAPSGDIPAQPAQPALPWDWPDERAADAPLLPPLTLEDEVAWDIATQDLSARPHPLTFRRRWLNTVGVLPIAHLANVPEGQRVIIAGKVISAQRPPTAKGMGFLVLEDETGRLQVALPPALADTLRLVLAESRLVAVSGRVERTRWHRSLLGRQVRPLPPPERTTQTQPSAVPAARRGPPAASPPPRAPNVPQRQTGALPA